MAKSLTPHSALVARFAVDVGALAPPDAKLGIAVSGGPDSVALLLLAAAARRGAIEAATVDHALRPGSREEAELVAELCDKLGVRHAILTAEWEDKPDTAIQEKARAERYRLLGRWLGERGLSALVTAHHLDDQVETLVMRLNRGSGARGLAGMRPVAPIPGCQAPLIRPLLGWRRAELEEICRSAGIGPAQDPSNEDKQFERVRVRRGLASAAWLDPVAIARSAAHLASADAALDWAVDREWESRVTRSAREIGYRPEAPLEIRRQIVRRSVCALANEGEENPLRGRELDRLVEVLTQGGTATLRGVLCTGGEEWRFRPAPARKT